MAGSGPLGLAAESLRLTHALDWHMVEEQEVFRNSQILNLHLGMSAIVDEADSFGDEEFIDEFSDPEGNDDSEAIDFRDLEPGTPAWTTYFKTHPAEQEEMLLWKKEKEGK